MKKRFFAMFLMFGLMMSFVGQTAILAQDGRKPDLNRELRFLTDYGKLLERYAKDCDSIRNESRPNVAQLKKCLTISQDLLDKLRNFRDILESVREKIKGVGQWNAKLDEELTKNGTKLGIDQKFIDLVNESGGLRSTFDKSFNSLDKVRVGLQEEIKYYESIKEKTGSEKNSVGDAVFTKVSATKSLSVRTSKWVCIAIFAVAAGSAASGVGAGVAVAAGANLVGIGCLSRMF